MQQKHSSGILVDAVTKIITCSIARLLLLPCLPNPCPDGNLMLHYVIYLFQNDE